MPGSSWLAQKLKAKFYAWELDIIDIYQILLVSMDTAPVFPPGSMDGAERLFEKLRP